MSPLERRCRLLMRAYPASYRRERGDEILATLLEATPEGRRRPLLRDMRALIMAGLHARAAQRRRFTMAVNLRLAVLAGVCIYLGVTATGDLYTFFAYASYRGVPMAGRIGWPALLAVLLVGTVVILAWLARRWVVIAAAAATAAAAAGYYGFSSGQFNAFVVTELVCLAAVVALTLRKERSPASLWLIGAVVAVLFLPGYLQLFTDGSVFVGSVMGLWPVMELCVVVIAMAWVATDARPLIAVATYFVLSWVPPMIEEIGWGATNWFFNPPLPIVLAIAAVAVWRLRRQSVRPGRAVQ